MSHRFCSLGKGIHLKDAHRAIPNNHLGISERMGKGFLRCRPDIESHPVISNGISSYNLIHRIRGKPVGNHHIRRQQEVYSFFFGLGDQRAG